MDIVCVFINSVQPHPHLLLGILSMSTCDPDQLNSGF
jgi:hypothetical protein